MHGVAVSVDFPDADTRHRQNILFSTFLLLSGLVRAGPWLIAGIQRFIVPPRLVTGQVL